MGKTEGSRQRGRAKRWLDTVLVTTEHEPYQNYQNLHQIDIHIDCSSMKSPWLRIELKVIKK
jgi:hypothetical protein